MKYFEEMQSKYGFSDGDATPNGIEEYRTAYILAINALAARLGSSNRAFAFDRAGMHNWCFVLFTGDTEALNVGPENLTDGTAIAGGPRYSVVERVDDAMNRAIELAQDKQIDGYVAVTVECSDASEIISDMASTPLATEDETEVTA